MSNIPLIIMHLGDHSYFQKCVNLNSKFNDILLIGDQTNIRTFTANPRVKHYHVFNLETDDTREFRKYFKNYSTNSFDAEYTCFVRYFHYITIMDELGIDKIATCDSDCVVFEDVNKLWSAYMKPGINAAMPYDITQTDENTDKACNSFGLLTRDFCLRFVNLIRDVYLHQTQYSIIDKKIRWHAINEIPGGISDMTLLSHMWSNGDMVNLTGTEIYDNEICVFDWNLQSASGFKGKDTYVVLQSGIKYAKKTMGSDGSPKFYFATKDMEYIRALSFHFQGFKSKALLETFNM